MKNAMPQLNSPVGLAIVAPSGAPLDDAAVLTAVTRLQQQGFQVHQYYQPEQRFQRFGAGDAQRVAQIHAAANNPAVQVVMALRGSYGLSRLMPLLDWDLLANCGKTFVGYSDFTLMHQALLARGCRSIAGPMLCDDYTRDDQSAYTQGQFLNCLQQAQHELEFVTDFESDLQISGRLWGGNLAMLAHAVGTPYAHSEEGGILFLEDIGEHPYRVERMLLQLHYAGVLKQQKAIVLGDFSGYRLASHDHGYDFAAMLTYLRSIVSVPIVTGLPFGHIRERCSLLVGAEAELILAQQKARLIMR